MNLVHRVGVIFHGNDRLTRHMSKIGDKFVGLEAKQRAWEQAQRDAGKEDAKLVKLQQQSAQRREQLATRWKTLNNSLIASQARLTEAQRKHELANDVFWAERERKLADNHRKVKELTAKHQAEMEAKEKRYYARLGAVSQKQAEAEMRSARTLKADQNKLKKLQARDHKELSPNDIHNAQTRIRDYNDKIARLSEAAELARLSATRTDKGKPIRVRDAETGQLRDLNVTERAALESAAVKSFNRQISQLNQAKSREEQRVQRHQQIVALNEKIAKQEASLQNLRAKHDAANAAAFKQHQDDLHELHAMQVKSAAAKKRQDEAEFDRWQTLHARKLTDMHNQLQMQEQQAARQRVHFAEQQQAMEVEMNQRRNLVREQKRSLDTAEREARVQAEITAQAERRHLWLSKSAEHMRGGSGMVFGGTMTAGGGLYAGDHLASKYGDVQLAERRLTAMGHTPQEQAIVQKHADALSKKLGTITPAEVLHNYGFLHAALGGPEGVLGPKLQDPRELEFFTKFKLGQQGMWQMGDADAERLAKAAELTSSSNFATGAPYTHAQRAHNFQTRLDVMATANAALGGQLQAGQISQMVKTLQANKFALSDTGFLRLLFQAQELDGGRAGTAITSALQNLSGRQGSAQNTLLAEAGLLGPINDKTIPSLEKSGQVTFARERDGALKRNARGFPIVSKFAPAALQGHELMAQDPGAYFALMFAPKARDYVKQHPELFGKDLGRGVDGFLKQAIGIRTGQGIIQQSILQQDRLEMDVQRAKHAKGSEAQYDLWMETYSGQRAKFRAGWEEFSQELGKSVFPTMTSMLTQLTDFLRSAKDLMKEGDWRGKTLGVGAQLGLKGAIYGGATLAAAGAARMGYGLANFATFGLLERGRKKMVERMTRRAAARAAARAAVESLPDLLMRKGTMQRVPKPSMAKRIAMTARNLRGGTAKVLSSLATATLPEALARGGSIMRASGIGAQLARMMTNAASVVRVGGLKVVTAMRGVMLALASPQGAMVLAAAGLGIAIGTAIQKGLEHFGLAEKFQQYLADRLPPWLGGRDREKEARMRQEQEDKLRAKTGLTAQQYEEYSLKRAEAKAAGKAYHSPQQEAALLSGAGPLRAEAATQLVAQASAPGKAAVQQAINPTGGYTLGRQDKLVIEFQGTPPQGVDPRRIEQEIVKNATKGGTGSRLMPGPWATGFVGAH